MTQDLQEKIKYLLNERIEARGNEWRREQTYKEWKATKFEYLVSKKNRDAPQVFSSFLLSRPMTCSTLIKSSTIANEQVDKTNQPYILTQKRSNHSMTQLHSQVESLESVSSDVLQQDGTQPSILPARKRLRLRLRFPALWTDMRVHPPIRCFIRCPVSLSALPSWRELPLT